MTFQKIRLLFRQHTIGGAQQERQPRVDKVHLRERNRDVAAQHDTLVEHVVDDVEERGVLGAEQEFGVRLFPGHQMKLYGGQGPVSETTRPDPSSVFAWRRVEARKAAVRRVGTRNAASSSSRDPGAACSVAVCRRESLASLAIALKSRSASARAAFNWTRLTLNRSRLRAR